MMLKTKLNNDLVSKLRRENMNDGTVKDTLVRHLYLQVNRKSKKWYHIETFDGERKKYLLGEFPQVSVEDARNKSLCFDPDMRIEDNKASMSVAEVFSFYYDKKGQHTKSSSQMQSVYRNHVETRFNKVKVSNFTIIDAEDWHSSITRQNGPVVANRALQYLRAAFNYCIKRELIDVNPTQAVELNKEESRERFLSKKEMSLLLNNMDCVAEIHRDIIKVLLFTGQRKSQVLAMRWDELDFDDLMWYATVKGGKRVAIPITEEVVRILERRYANKKDGKDFVFYQHGNRNGHVKNMEVAWNKVRKATGLKDVTLHDLRRTLASWQVIHGESMKVVQDTLTHSSQASTQIYARLDNDTVRDSVERTVQKMKDCL